MKKTIYTCDHCGKELDEMQDFPECETDVNGELIRFDLCENCFNKLGTETRDFLSGNRRKRIIAGEKKDTES